MIASEGPTNRAEAMRAERRGADFILIPEKLRKCRMSDTGAISRLL